MMISRRSINNIIFAIVCAALLLSTPRLLNDWVSDYGDNQTGQSSPKSHSILSQTSSSTAPHSHSTSFAVPTAEPSDNDRPSRHPDLASSRAGHDAVCDGFPDTSDIFLVVKTGATEAFDRIPTQLMTVLRCIPDFLIFSDLEQNIAGHHIHDSLETVLDEARENNTNFDLYRKQKACDIDQNMCASTMDGPKDAAWNLDKYKNIHMAEKTYCMRPGYDWYVFIDADTYVSWPNLVQMLRRLDPAKERYLGSTTVIGDMPFGHGGSGYAVSGAAMKGFAKNPGVANSFDLRIMDTCCGDYMFAVALNDTIGVTVDNIVSVERGTQS